MTAFAEAVRLYREGHSEESLTILRSIFDVDAQFKPAQRLDAAINANAPVDLAQLLGEMSAASGEDAAIQVAKAREAFEQRNFGDALSLAQSVLRDLPGHPEARKLLLESQARLRSAGEQGSLLARTRDALAAGHIEEAQGFLRLARNLDPSHPELAALELELPAPLAAPELEPEFEFEVFDQFGGGERAPEPPAAAPSRPGRPEGLASFEAGFEDGLPPEEGLPVPPGAAPAGELPGGFAPPVPAGTGPTRPTVAPAMPVAPMARTVAAPVPPAAAGEFKVAPLAAAPTPGPPISRPPAGAGPLSSGFEGVPHAPVPTGGFSFDSSADEDGMDFGAVAMPSSGPADFLSVTGSEGRVQELLDQGQAAFESGDYQSAIETWSRIYLVDAHHAEAELRIEQARRRREEVDRLAEHRFYEAREAFDQGRLVEAGVLCREVIGLQPQHLEANDLLQRLETPSAPPPPPTPPLAADEDDLFKDDFVPASIGSAPVATTAPTPLGGMREARRPGAPAEAGVRKIAGIPTLWLAVGGAALVVLLAGGLFLGGKLMSRGSGSVTATIGLADSLAEQGQLADAIRVLESLSAQLEGEQANLVNARILALKKRLRAQATPAPAFDSKAIRAAISAGQRLKAWQMVQDGLAKASGEPELTALQGELSSYSSWLPTLARAVRESDWETARAQADRMRQDHPEDGEALRVWSVATYNQAVLLLRKYQVAAAGALLGELVKQGDDPAVAKLQQFARSYLSRPADPRYEIFVNNTELRRVE